MPESYEQACERAKWIQRYEEFVEDMWVPSEDFSEDKVRCALALAEEGGEVAGKVKKWLRGDVAAGKLTLADHEEQILSELGDILFYVVKMAHIHRCTLRDVINFNVEKLTSRKERGQILGSGDNR